jgi:hypothetical protein
VSRRLEELEEVVSVVERMACSMSAFEKCHMNITYKSGTSSLLTD